MIHGKTPRFVSAAEITRNFGMWQDRAAQAPLMVTHHGRPRVVILSADDYELLSQRDEDRAPANQESTALTLLQERIEGGFAVYDPQLRFLRLNGAALVYLDRSADQLIGRSLTELYPTLEDGPIVAMLRRVVRSGQAATLDFPGALRPGRRLHLHAFPWPGGVALLFRDVTEEQDSMDALAERDALAAARDSHGEATTARLSLRATFERIDAPLGRLAGFSLDRLLGVRLVDLLALSQRGAAMSEIEAVLSRGETRGFLSRLLVNGDGDGERPVRIGLAPVRDGFAIVGAMLMLTAL